MHRLTTSLRRDLRRHPWMVPGVLFSGSAALGTALSDLLVFIGGLF
jgi:hypothetical protein